MRSRKVLVVDDEMDMRIYITTLLETSGYKPIIATNGEEGIEQARKHKPAAIILDVLMPKSGGVEMYRQVKTDENLKDIPVIMISAIAKKTFFHSMQMLNSYRGQTVPNRYARMIARHLRPCSEQDITYGQVRFILSEPARGHIWHTLTCFSTE
jgi:CheY-like chemotaxis protein